VTRDLFAVANVLVIIGKNLPAKAKDSTADDRQADRQTNECNGNHGSHCTTPARNIQPLHYLQYTLRCIQFLIKRTTHDAWW